MRTLVIARTSPLTPSQRSELAKKIITWQERYQTSIESFEFFADSGGSFMLVDTPEEGVLYEMILNWPLTSFSDLEMLPVIGVSTVLKLWHQQGNQPTVIDFEDTTTDGRYGEGPFETVNDQYASDGVHFNDVTAFDYSKDDNIDPGFAHSGTKAIEQCYETEFCTTPIEITFDTPLSRVKVWVGYSGFPSQRGMDESHEVMLRAFDSNDVEVGNDSTTITGSVPIPIDTPLEVSLADATISTATVTLMPDIFSGSPPEDLPATNHLAVDDVEFE